MENNGQKDYSIWSLEKFQNEIWDIYPEGNKDWVYKVMVANVTNQNFTFELIKKKFKDYIDSLKPFQNGKYTPKEKKIKTLETFLNEDLYLEDFVTRVIPSNPIRDEYLYGTPPK